MGNPSQKMLGCTEALAKLSHIEIVVALGETPSVWRKQKRNMAIPRFIVSEQTLKVDLPRRRAQQVTPANNLVHSHRCIVNHNGKLIGEDPVAAPDEKISALQREGLLLPSEDAVGKRDGSFG